MFPDVLGALFNATPLTSANRERTWFTVTRRTPRARLRHRSEVISKQALCRSGIVSKLLTSRDGLFANLSQ
jgi:hypothetical protein